MPKLDDFEKDILESVENDEWTSKDNLPKRAEELKGYLSNQKKKAISIRISENDLYLLKKSTREWFTISKCYSNANTSIYNR